MACVSCDNTPTALAPWQRVSILPCGACTPSQTACTDWEEMSTASGHLILDKVSASVLFLPWFIGNAEGVGGQKQQPTYCPVASNFAVVRIQVKRLLSVNT